MVLDGEHCLLHVLRDGRQRHIAALLPAAAAHERGQERCVELNRLGALATNVETTDAAAPERHADNVITKIARSPLDRDRVALDAELARRVGLVSLGVPKIVQS